MRNAQFKIVSLEEHTETHQIAATTPNTEEEAVTALQKLELRRLVAALPFLQREVVSRYYGLAYPLEIEPTQASIGAEFGLSNSQVGRLLLAARATLLRGLAA